MIEFRNKPLYEEHPGRAYLDAWGWEAGLYYQRDLPYGDNLDYFKKHVIDESYKWGCNSLDVYVQAPPPPIDRYALPMEWHPDDPIEGSKQYKYLYDPKWNNANLMELTKYAHSRDMLFDWYLNDVPFDGCAPWFGQVKKFSEAETQSKLKLIDNLIEKIARDFMNPLVHGWRGSLDGIKEEDFPHDSVAWDRLMWPYNPGAFIALTPPYLVFPDVVAPNMIALYACGMKGRHDSNDPNGPFFPVRRDHSSWHTDYSRIFVNYQGTSRTNRISSEIWGTYFAAHSGGIFPDLILKQCNDFFRPRVTDHEDIHETVIWWLGESLNICPREVRRYVLAISQDPIKCAVAVSEGSITPARVCYIQNNFLRIYSFQEKEGARLLCDPEGSAHFDANSQAFALTENLVKTAYVDTQGRTYERNMTSDGGQWLTAEEHKETYEKVVSFSEPGGYKAVLREDYRNPSSSMISAVLQHETRELLMFSDNPFFQLRIQRVLLTDKGKMTTALGCEGYDRVFVGDAPYDTAVDIPLSDTENIFTLEDSSSSKPTLVVLFLERGNIVSLRWIPSEALIFESPARPEEQIGLGFVVPAFRYSLDDMPLLREAMMDEDVPLQLTDDRVSVTNKYPLPLVRTVRVSQPDNRPYLVQEYGWWMFRGANPSAREKEIDFLKVYLNPKGTAEILRYGFIDGVVKPGWGCQYMLALKDVMVTASGASCTARVTSVTPLIFSPRVHFKEPFTAARVNGSSWHYFDDEFVYLPNRAGDYHVEVIRQDRPPAPRIIRTFASVASTEWTGSELVIKAALPPHADKLPPDLQLYAALEMTGLRVTKIRGGEVTRTLPDGIVISFRPGTIVVSVA